MSIIASETEVELLDHMVSRLVQRFPTVEAEHIREVVVAQYDAFDAARVRDFVPVFVEREAVARFRREGVPSAGAAGR